MFEVIFIIINTIAVLLAAPNPLVICDPAQKTSEMQMARIKNSK